MLKLYREIFDFFRLNIKEISLIILITKFPLIALKHALPAEISAEMASLIIFASIVSMALSNGAMTILFSTVLSGEKKDVKLAIIRSFSYLPRMIIALMIYSILIFLGLFLLIVPGVIIGARLSLYNYYLIYENFDPFRAIKESAISTNGFTAEITILFILMTIIVYGPYLVILKFFAASHITNLLIFSITELIFSIAGTLVLVLTFRLYCLIKEKKGIFLK